MLDIEGDKNHTPIVLSVFYFVPCAYFPRISPSQDQLAMYLITMGHLNATNCNLL